MDNKKTVLALAGRRLALIDRQNSLDIQYHIDVYKAEDKCIQDDLEILQAECGHPLTSPVGPATQTSEDVWTRDEVCEICGKRMTNKEINLIKKAQGYFVPAATLNQADKEEWENDNSAPSFLKKVLE